MASRQELSEFLASVERRAYKQALFSVHNEDSALDLVQDAMLKLAEKYGDHAAHEFPMLFQRILQNSMMDFLRREKVRNTWVRFFSSFSNHDAEDEANFVESLQTEAGSQASETAADQVSREQIMRIIEEELARLPARQRDAFLMRYWEEMDVLETAAAMGCSEGSVKTHCFRATSALSQALKARGIEL
jgi:RNA polymerase sigma-70 factor (ECF subfamily)